MHRMPNPSLRYGFVTGDGGVIANESYGLLITIQNANPNENHGAVVEHHELIY